MPPDSGAPKIRDRFASITRDDSSGVTALAFLPWRSKSSVAHEIEEPVPVEPPADNSAELNTEPNREPREETSEDDRLCLILDSIPVPLWLRDPDLTLAFTNEAARNSGNLAAQRAAEIAARVQASGRPQTERRMVEADGKRRVMEITEAPLGFGKGSGTIGFAVEYEAPRTDELENTLMRERAVFDQMLEALGSGVAIFGPDKRLESFNSAYAGFWGLSEDWLAGRPTLTQVLEKLRDERRLTEVADFSIYRAQENALFDTLQDSRERMLHLPDGRTIRNTVAPASHGGLMHVYDDITDTLSLQRSNKTLDAVQRHTIDNLQEAVAVFGGDGRLKLHNAAFSKLWNLSISEEGTEDEREPHLSEIVDRMCDPGEAAGEWVARRATILSALTQRREHKARIRRTGSHGSQVLDMASVPLPDGAVLVSFLDITEEAKVEDALRARADMAEETDRLKSKFIADISYEVRTPLTTITGFSQILDAGYFGELTPRQQEYVRGIQETADSLMTVVADILELAAIESDTALLDKDAIDLHSLLAQSMALITQRARHKDLYLNFDVPTDLGWLSADGRRLKQVVFNLLSNAVRFTPARGGVQLSATRGDDGVTIAVTDNGVGIPQADIDRVFQKFAKGEQPDGEPDGAGLGLAMVKSFVELHGGTVTIKSSPNRGTTVTCFLPATGTEGGDARDAFQI